MTRAGSPATVPSRQDMNGNACGSRSMSSVSSASSTRLSGPAMAIVAQCSVTELQ